ncbi:MAG TPA: protein-disulfide reductase DsbD domain-containing protein [Bryobacteraceae bacterium]|nr:protein-disulfide reductase DsbD domain-containing protein [Bryobacteraceae bacterium]
MLTVAPPEKVVAKRGATAQSRVTVLLGAGYHVNSNTPSEDYLIPLRLTWTPGALVASEVTYPKPVMEKYSFSPKPISVFTGKFDVTTVFKVAPGASPGPGVMAGKLRYQACNDKACFPPKTVEVRLTYQIE